MSASVETTWRYWNVSVPVGEEYVNVSDTCEREEYVNVSDTCERGEYVNVSDTCERDRDKNIGYCIQYVIQYASLVYNISHNFRI
jgi:hypothetical protein